MQSGRCFYCMFCDIRCVYIIVISLWRKITGTFYGSLKFLIDMFGRILLLSLLCLSYCTVSCCQAVHHVRLLWVTIKFSYCNVSCCRAVEHVRLLWVTIRISYCYVNCCHAVEHARLLWVTIRIKMIVSRACDTFWKFTFFKNHNTI